MGGAGEEAVVNFHHQGDKHSAIELGLAAALESGAVGNWFATAYVFPGAIRALIFQHFIAH